MPYNLNIRGWMLERELQVIESWAKQLQSGSVVVEVGTFYGRSAYCFAATAPLSTVYCFDKWQGEVEQEGSIPLSSREELGYPLPGMVNTFEHFQSNVSGLANIKAKMIETPTNIKWDGTPVDLFFIDAAHSNPSDWEYIEYWLPHVKPGGWICGHDFMPYTREFPDVIDNVYKLQKILNKKVQTYKNTSLWRIQK